MSTFPAPVDDDGLVDAVIATEDEAVLLRTRREIKHLKVADFPIRGRAGRGRRIFRPKQGDRVIGLTLVPRELTEAS